MKSIFDEYTGLVLAILFTIIAITVFKMVVLDDESGLVFLFNQHNLYAVNEDESGNSRLKTINFGLDAINGVENRLNSSIIPFVSVADKSYADAVGITEFDESFDEHLIDFYGRDGGNLAVGVKSDKDTSVTGKGTSYGVVDNYEDFKAYVMHDICGIDIYTGKTDGSKIKVDTKDVTMIIEAYQPLVDWSYSRVVKKDEETGNTVEEISAKQVYRTKWQDAYNKYGNRIYTFSYDNSGNLTVVPDTLVKLTQAEKDADDSKSDAARTLYEYNVGDLVPRSLVNKGSFNGTNGIGVYEGFLQSEQMYYTKAVWTENENKDLEGNPVNIVDNINYFNINQFRVNNDLPCKFKVFFRYTNDYGLSCEYVTFVKNYVRTEEDKFRDGSWYSDMVNRDDPYGDGKPLVTEYGETAGEDDTEVDPELYSKEIQELLDKEDSESGEGAEESDEESSEEESNGTEIGDESDEESSEEESDGTETGDESDETKVEDDNLDSAEDENTGEEGSESTDEEENTEEVSSSEESNN